MKVFISGSINIKQLPGFVLPTLQTIISKEHHVLVGDADGIDRSVQDYLANSGYENVSVYSIYSIPRYNSGGFDHIYVPAPSDLKSERDRQKYKDRKMSDDCDSFLVVWDGKSKGCFANINSAISKEKHSKVYLQCIDNYLEKKSLNTDRVNFIYRSNVGYTASEFVDQLKLVGVKQFEHTRSLNRFLLQEKMIKKIGKVYSAEEKFKKLFISKYHRGKPSGINLTLDLVNWFEARFKTEKLTQTKLGI
jgi:hypothetical protein